MADDDVGANQLFHGEFILHKAEVIYFKKKKAKKMKKEPKKSRAILVITKADVGLNDPNKHDKPKLQFARDLIVDHRFNHNLDGSSLYKLELDVRVNGKIFTIFIEFPSATAHQDRFNFIQLFDSDAATRKAKQKQNSNQPNGSLPAPTSNGHSTTPNLSQSALNGNDSRSQSQVQHPPNSSLR